jgi:2-iminobutanoate/2-iminopropanoate deaminase
MMREIIRTKQAPAAIGPYSQAVRVGDFLFTAGQIPLDPASGEIVGLDATAQTRQVMRNLGAVLAAAGGDLGSVVKTTVFLTDMAHFADFNAVYAESFPGDDPPSRSTVAVASLPKGALVEVEAVAHLPGR